MGGIIKLTKRNHLALDNHFEATLSVVHQEPIPKGKKYKDYENENKIIVNLIDVHTQQKCSCVDGKLCLFKRYENKEITAEEIISFLR